jgi:hypothetical protein
MAVAAIGWLITALPVAAAPDGTEAPAHCGFLNRLAGMDLGLDHVDRVDANLRQSLGAVASHLQEEIRSPTVAAAFSELETMRIEAYLAAQQRAARMSGDSAASVRSARAQHPLPWRGPALSQKLALCDAQGGGTEPLTLGAGTGDHDDGNGGQSALSSQLRIPLVSGPLKADLLPLLLVALGTILLVLILRGLVGQSQRRSRRVFCFVPVIYSTGTQVRQGWLLDLSCHGCKLQTRGETHEAGASVRIRTGEQELSGVVIWTNGHYAGIDLHHELDPAQVDKIAFGQTDEQLAIR